MKNLKFLPVLLLVFSLACQKSKDKHPIPGPVNPDPQPAILKSTIPMAEGNYWIYERFTADSLGNVVRASNTIDSLMVYKDTSGALQYKLFSGRPGNLFPTLSNLNFYPLNVLSDSGTFYKLNLNNERFTVAQTSLPNQIKQQYSIWNSDTIYATQTTISYIPNPMPGNSNQAILINSFFPKAYLAPISFSYQNIWIKNTGLYRFETSILVDPYPKMVWRLIRYRLK